jgi:N-methylhydantoinase B
MTRPDPIAFELFRNALFSIADEMALTIFRTAYSGVLKDVMDYSTAFCDADGQTVAQGLTQPAHLFSFPEALAGTIRRYGDRLRPGDVYILNDPFEGGMHLPDVFILRPVFDPRPGGERLAWAATICHQTDVGGRVPGSNAADSTEIFQEGLRIPPLPLYEAGRPNATLFALLEKNVRLPVRLFGDLRSQLAACHVAETAFLRLVARHGVATVKASMAELPSAPTASTAARRGARRPPCYATPSDHLALAPLRIRCTPYAARGARSAMLGGRLIRHARYLALRLAESYLTGSLFRQILHRIERLAGHPTGSRAGRSEGGEE